MFEIELLVDFGDFVLVPAVFLMELFVQKGEFGGFVLVGEGDVVDFLVDCLRLLFEFL